MSSTEEDDITIEGANVNCILIAGESASGKSASLRNLENQEGVLYINCESGKPLPFKNKFHNCNVVEPVDAIDYLLQGIEEESIHTIVIDTVTFLMDIVEIAYTDDSAGFDGWKAYNRFFKRLMKEISKTDKRIIVLAHNLELLDKKDAVLKTSVPIKGALRNQGIEAYFTTVVYAAKVTLKELEKFKNDMLTISAEDELVGYKHVFQTRLTKKTVHSRIRSPMGLFSVPETYIDNDAELLLAHINKFYA